MAALIEDICPHVEISDWNPALLQSQRNMIGNAFSYVGSLKSHYQYYSSFCTLPFEVPAPFCNFLSESNPVGPSLRANFATEKDCPNRYLCLFSVVVILLYVSLLFDLKRQRSISFSCHFIHRLLQVLHEIVSTRKFTFMKEIQD